MHRNTFQFVWRWQIWSCGWLWCAASLLGADVETPEQATVTVQPVTDAQAAEWFEREVRPLLAERCLSCHSSSLALPKAGLMLDRRETILSGGDSGPAAEVGRPDASLIIQAIHGQGMQRMPPDKPLTKAEIVTLRRWVQEGMPWPESQSATVANGPDWLVERARNHWAWQPIVDPPLPEASDKRWPARPLDSFIQARQALLGVEPAVSAQSSQLLRRLAYDLTGLPPAAEHTAEFLAATDAERGYVRLVDRYLASPQFGVTWGRHWFDLVRYCETLGHEFDHPVRHAWRYRDAVIDALNTDLPYDQFLKDHVAGDLSPQSRRHPLSGIDQSVAMTGWWWMGEAMHAPVDVWSDEAIRLDNQIDVFSKAFLGLTIACARCHDHKFDAISMQDYTSLVGVLQSSRRTYALDDSHGNLSAHNDRLAAEFERRSHELQGQWNSADLPTDGLRNWIEQIVGKIGQDLEQSRKTLTLSHPMYSLRLIAESTSETDFSRRHRQIAERLSTTRSKAEAWLAASPLLADFKGGLPEGWYIEAADARLTNWDNNSNGLRLFDPAGPIPAQAHAFASHALGRQQQLSLRSRSFDLTHPMVALKLRGKNVQSSIVVDNYFMNEFTGLLFSDLRKKVDQPHDWGWIVHAGDLDKYLGHPSYVSIDDEDDGWFELSEVRLCQSPPPEFPHELNNRLLEREGLTREQLINDLITLLRFSVPIASTSIDNASTVKTKTTQDATQDTTPSAIQPLSGAVSDSALVRESAIDALRGAIQEGERNALPLPLPQLDCRPLEQAAQGTPKPVRLIAIHEGTPRDAPLALRGNPHARGSVIDRGQLQALGGESVTNPVSSGRAEWADRLTSRQNPLVARVFVNRVWMHLLGQGLVESPDNFGVLGGAPSHPELLDYLASRFVEHDWSLKWLVREICLSRTYRLSSLATAKQLEADPTGRWLTHRSVRRISAEKLRDGLLAISGSLDRSAAGESIQVHLTEQMTGRGRPKESGPLDGNGRRSTYIEIRRNFLDPFLVAFDQPPPATTVGRRNGSNVPAQALSLLNAPLVHELADRWSRRVCREYTSDAERVQAMFVAAFARQPNHQEMALCLSTVGSPDAPMPTQAEAVGAESTGVSTRSVAGTTAGISPSDSEDRWRQLAHVLICTKEFQYLP